MAITKQGFSGATVDERGWSYLNNGAAVHTYGMAVTATAGTRNVSVASGYVKVPGVLVESDSAATVTLDANTSGLPRIDVIVVDVNWSADTTSITFVKGTPAASPTAPTLEQSPGWRWQHPLAEVAVANGATTFSAGNVTDRRVFGGPVITGTSDMIRPAAAARAIIIENDSGRIIASNGSSYAVVKNQRQRGKDSATISSGQTVAGPNTVNFPTAFLSTPYVQLTGDDSRVNVSIASVSTTQLTWYARWVSGGTPGSNVAVTVHWSAES